MSGKSRTYDSTVARIAGNILSGLRPHGYPFNLDEEMVQWSVALARAVVAEVERTEPKPEVQP